MSTSLAVVLLATGMRLVASHDVSRSGYADGAPPGFSGGFKEDSCQACHFHEPLNALPGELAIEGVPAAFVAGERYSLTIRLTRDGMKLSGFQLTARFKETGAQAGAFAAPADEAERVKIESSSGIQYAGHKLAGSNISEAGAARWVVHWTAPSSGGAVIFNVSANAANGDERVDGDFIYSASIETAPPP
jgi:hypothetical protein